MAAISKTFIIFAALLAILATLVACGDDAAPVDTSQTDAKIAELETKLTDTEAMLAEAESKMSAMPTAGGDQGERITELETKLADTEAMLAEAESKMSAMPAGGEDQGDRLQAVKDRGKVICASRNDVPGYGSLDSQGNNVGFDIDLCRALGRRGAGRPQRHRDPPDYGRRARADHSVGRGRHAGPHRYLDDFPRFAVGQLRPDDVL